MKKGIVIVSDDPESMSRESTRRRIMGLSEEEKAARKKAREEVVVKDPPPGMPLYIDSHIKRKFGKEVTLIMMKVLSAGDENRLLISTVQITQNIGFLRPEEVQRLEDGKEINVGIVSSELKEKELFLKLEKKLPKKVNRRSSGTSSVIRSYMLTGDWKDFATESMLHAGDRVRLWSYRVERDDHEDLLQFAIAKIGEKETEHVVPDGESGRVTVIVEKGSVRLIYK